MTNILPEAQQGLAFELMITPADINLATHKLGKQAAGVVLLPNVITNEHLEALQSEVATIPAGKQRDVHNVITNKRGVEVPQNYWAHALRLDKGDQEPVDQLPLLLGLTHSLKTFVNTRLSGPFGRLRNWTPTEMAVHHYDQPLGLGFHYDHKHYWGVIAVANLDGQSEFQTRGIDGKLTATIPTEPGDIVLMRGSNLYSSDDTVTGPEHSVQNVGADGRTSLVVRSSMQPDKEFDGFTYENWPTQSSS